MARQDTRTVSPDLYQNQRYREGKFVCDICLMLWPMSHQRKMRGGQRVGKLCCFEPEGDEVERDIRRAAANKMASQTSKKELRPPQAPDGSFYAGITELAADSYITSITPSSVVLVRGGAAVSVVLVGVGFSASDSIVYGNAGITDNVAPSLNLATPEWDLQVKASGGTPVGKYTLTFNGTLWQGVFDVR